MEDCKGKKGIFALSFFILSLFVVSYGIFAFSTQDLNSFTRIVGGESVKLNEMFNQGKAANLYAEQASKYAIVDTIQELARSVGTNFRCGSYNGMAFLETSTERCYFNEDQIKTNFKNIFNKKLRFYFDKYTKAEFSDYETNFDGQLEVSSDGQITVRDEDNWRKIRSHFVTKINFDLDAFTKLIKYLDDLECYDLLCWQNNLANYPGYTFSISENNNLFIFEAVSNNKLKTFFGEKEVRLQFVIDPHGGDLKKDVE